MNVKKELQKIMAEHNLTPPLSNKEKKFVIDSMEKLIKQFEDEESQIPL